MGWLGLRNPHFRQRWPERFGFLPAVPPGQHTIWVHAASVGEVQAATPLIHALRERYPERPFVVTTVTPTGAKQAEHRLGDDAVHRFLPFDFPSAVERFLKRIQPALAVVMETELWPNLFAACHRRGVPLVLVNARISERSILWYQRVASLLRTTLSNVSAIAAQSREDAERFISLGADPCKVVVVGSTKFDNEVPTELLEQAASLRRFFGVNRPVWIAASTHEGEELIILDAFEEILAQHASSLLIIAPRHQDRFARVAGLCERRGFATVKASQDSTYDMKTQVFIVDSLGDLPAFYGTSDIAFVGGSLVPTGGHNMLEPASLGIPVLMGPHVFNFRDISQWLLEVEGAWIVSDSEELASKVVSLFSDASLRNLAGEKARQVVRAHRGAVERILAVLSPYFPG